MRIVCEYIWLGGGSELRSKTRVINIGDSNQLTLKSIPVWNYDGSSTGQASGDDSEVILHPVAMFRDPFRQGSNSFLVLCETRRPDGTPLTNNHRNWANFTFQQDLSYEPWYGIEQEYFIMDKTTGKPLGFPEDGSDPAPQGQYYCSVGAANAFGRKVANTHLQACLYAGLQISGINAEVAPGQWEYQIGPCTGINSGDEVWVSRYILERVAEEQGVVICWDPKPVKGAWNGSGCHTNYSTKYMREGTDNKHGLEYIYDAIKQLEKAHDEHMEVYGTGNKERMTGGYETSDYNTFSYGVANRGASVRIGNDIVEQKKGYFEDRRPSSNMDPYLVTAKIFETTALRSSDTTANVDSHPTGLLHT